MAASWTNQERPGYGITYDNMNAYNAMIEMESGDPLTYDGVGLPQVWTTQNKS